MTGADQPPGAPGPPVARSDERARPRRLFGRRPAARTWVVFTIYALVMRWDCTSPNPAEHWTNVTVRYCWSDFQTILQAIAGKSNIRISDPQTIDRAWGRPF
jgi:hypothetical protein